MQLKKFSQAAQNVLIESKKLAQKNHNLATEPEHLALALIMTAELKELVKKKSVEHKALLAALLDLISKLPVGDTEDPHFSQRLIQSLSSADALAMGKGHAQIVVSDLFLSLIENRDKYGALGGVLAQFFLEQSEKDKKHKSAQLVEDKNSTLFSVADNVNYLIKNNQLDPVFDREQEIEQLVQILSRKSRNNPILIGESGVGRTSIVYALVKRIIEQNVPSYLVSKEILALDVGALVSGTTLRGQFEERIKKMLTELSDRQGHYILLVRDLSLLMGAGGDGASDAANLIKPSLAKGLIQMIGLVTPEAYKKRIEADPSFERYFQPLWINPPTLAQCETILSGLKAKYEQFHGVFIEEDALKAAVELGSRHLSGQVLPELALDVLDEACSRHRIIIDKKPQALIELHEKIAKLERQEAKKDQAQTKNQLAKLKASLTQKTAHYEHELSIIAAMRAIKGELLGKDQGGKQALVLELEQREQSLLAIKKNDRLIDPWVKRDDIAAVISLKTGIPVKKMMQSEREKLALMEDLLGKNVIGQPEAILAVANAIRRARVGLKDPKKPIGSFLFLGPTGVGKTELARTLTNFLFDDERAMVRFDMSEFMERHSVARLIGAPPGYQGADEGGQLTEKVRRKPYSVVLFDEIEKAHADVLNVLLQVLDEGRLTDSKGNLVQFANTVIIMTSNVGSDILLQDEELDKQTLRSMIMERLLGHLRPELINRIDEIVIFNPIDMEGIRGIAQLMLKNVMDRLRNEGFSLTIDEKAQNLLIKEGYSREFGARPLKRTIQRLIENPLAMALVKGGFKKGDRIEAYLTKEGAIDFKKDQVPK
jgi:ATP-dependent Clp protease ATP-binding subunit ClpB